MIIITISSYLSIEVINWSYILKYLLTSSSKIKKELRELKKSNNINNNNLDVNNKSLIEVTNNNNNNNNNNSNNSNNNNVEGTNKRDDLIDNNDNVTVNDDNNSNYSNMKFNANIINYDHNIRNNNANNSSSATNNYNNNNNNNNLNSSSNINNHYNYVNINHDDDKLPSKIDRINSQHIPISSKTSYVRLNEPTLSQQRQQQRNNAYHDIQQQQQQHHDDYNNTTPLSESNIKNISSLATSLPLPSRQRSRSGAAYSEDGSELSVTSTNHSIRSTLTNPSIYQQRHNNNHNDNNYYNDNNDSNNRNNNNYNNKYNSMRSNKSYRVGDGIIDYDGRNVPVIQNNYNNSNNNNNNNNNLLSKTTQNVNFDNFSPNIAINSSLEMTYQASLSTNTTIANPPLNNLFMTPNIHNGPNNNSSKNVRSTTPINRSSSKIIQTSNISQNKPSNNPTNITQPPSDFAKTLVKKLDINDKQQSVAAMSVIDKVSQITDEQLALLDETTRKQILSIRSELGINETIQQRRSESVLRNPLETPLGTQQMGKKSSNTLTERSINDNFVGDSSSSRRRSSSSNNFVVKNDYLKNTPVYQSSSIDNSNATLDINNNYRINHRNNYSKPTISRKSDSNTMNTVVDDNDDDNDDNYSQLDFL